ncbi:MAG TPA: zf-HC2 domain-containing protein [Longimicrobiales bacterium]|nr:zf-HC2 domain-containing protein [Longimicrobiales bacterium]
MSNSHQHPTPERLQALAEQSLDEAERVSVQSHVASCERCQAELEEWQSLFTMLAALPQQAPSAGFAQRVMAGVVVHQPWPVRVGALLRRLVPETTAGWATATAVLALPVLACTGLLTWLMSQPGVTAQGLWLILANGVSSATGAAGSWLWSQWLQSPLAAYAVTAFHAIGSRSGGVIGLSLVALATLTAGSVWILYENLFRRRARRTHYASYSF